MSRLRNVAHVAQLVEHFLGKGEVTGSNPVAGSIVVFLRKNFQVVHQGRKVKLYGKKSFDYPSSLSRMQGA